MSSWARWVGRPMLSTCIVELLRLRSCYRNVIKTGDDVRGASEVVTCGGEVHHRHIRSVLEVHRLCAKLISHHDRHPRLRGRETGPGGIRVGVPPGPLYVLAAYRLIGLLQFARIRVLDPPAASERIRFVCGDSERPAGVRARPPRVPLRRVRPSGRSLRYRASNAPAGRRPGTPERA